MNEPDSEIHYTGPERRKEVRPSLRRGKAARRQAVTGRRFSELFLTWALVLFTLYVLSGYFIIPSIINNLLPSIFSGSQTRVSISSSSFDPFTLMLDINNLTISLVETSPESIKPVLIIKDMHLNIEIDSLFKKALICRNANFTGVSLDLERRADLSYNLGDLIIPEAGKKSGKTRPLLDLLPPFSLQNISLVNGLIRFNDKPGGKRHLIEQILLNLPALANFETGAVFKATGVTGQPLQPRFSAIINGSPIALRGRNNLAEESTDTRLDLKLHDLDITAYLPYLPAFRETGFLSGLADLDLELIFASSPGSGSALKLQGAVNFANLTMKRKNGSTVAIPETSVRGSFALLPTHFTLQEIIIRKPVLTVAAQQSTTAESLATVFRDLLGELAGGSANLVLNRLQLVDGTIIEKSRKKEGPDHRWTDINITVSPPPTGSGKPASFNGKVKSPWGTIFTGRGTLSFTPLQSNGTIGVSDIEIGRLNDGLATPLPYGITGGVIKTGSAVFSLGSSPEQPDPVLSLSGITLDLVDLSFKSTGHTLFFPTIRSTNGSIDNAQRLFNLGAITGELATLDFNPEIFIQPGPAVIEAGDHAWSIASQSIALTGSNISVGALHLVRSEIHGEGLGSGTGIKGKIRISAALADQGTVTLSGTIGFAPPAASLSGSVDQISLAALKNSLALFLIPNITSGEISGEGTFTFPALKITGNVSVHDLAAEISTGKRSLTCPAITIKDMELAGSPPSLKMRELNFEQPRFQVIVTDRKSPALAGYIFPDSFQASIISDLIGIKNGSFQLLDHSTMPASEIMIDSIEATMKSMRNQPEILAPFDLTGSWLLINSPADRATDQQTAPAPLQVTGQAALFGSNPRFEVEISSSGIDITSLAPYLGPLLGYQPDRGSISISTNLHLADHKINATNTLKVAGLSLGQGLSGRYNTTLAAAILTDPDGLITIDSPVSGKLKDISFSYSGTIATRIRDILLKTTLSPFSLLEIPENDRNESLEFLSFDPGSSELRASQIEQLRELAAAFKSRPLLMLSISGHVDPALDLTALQNTPENRSRTLASRVPEAGTTGSAIPQGIRITTSPDPLPTESAAIGDAELIELARERGRRVREQLLKFGLQKKRVHLDEKVFIEDEILNRPAGRVDLDLFVTRIPPVWN